MVYFDYTTIIGGGMIRWVSAPEGVSGFTFLPVWEIGVGIFLLIAAFVIPTLFLVYNGINTGQWMELLFCVVFFLFFGFLGYKLVFQSLSASAEGEMLHVQSNLRDPEVHFSCKTVEWKTARIGAAEDQDGKTYATLQIVTNKGFNEVYRSVNNEEIKEICGAFMTLHNQQHPPTPTNE